MNQQMIVYKEKNRVLQMIQDAAAKAWHNITKRDITKEGK